jgi:hypothetical protein
MHEVFLLRFPLPFLGAKLLLLLRLLLLLYLLLSFLLLLLLLLLCLLLLYLLLSFLPLLLLLLCLLLLLLLLLALPSWLLLRPLRPVFVAEKVAGARRGHNVPEEFAQAKRAAGEDQTAAASRGDGSLLRPPAKTGCAAWPLGSTAGPAPHLQSSDTPQPRTG